MSVTKRSKELTLWDRLSRLTYRQVAGRLGDKADRLLALGGSMEIDIEQMVQLDDERFELDLGDARVSVFLDDGAQRRLKTECSECEGSCHHLGAAFSLLLEEKMQLGLSKARPDESPLGMLSEEELVSRALKERETRARDEDMVVRSEDKSTPWADYTVTNRTSGRAYRVALRGMEKGVSYCACPDFRTNTLGTCKHIIRAQSTLKRRFSVAQINKPYSRQGVSVVVDYSDGLTLKVLAADKLTYEAQRVIEPFLGAAVEDVTGLLFAVRRLESAGVDVNIYPDAEEFIQARLLQARLRDVAGDIRSNPNGHPLRKTLLRVDLLPHQMDGIAFAAQVGRAVLADDMGLGKTIQGIGVAELLARVCQIGRVLVICPASLKAQWRSEIERFSDRDCQVILGAADERRHQYSASSFFTICNYEQVLRDITLIETRPWDLIILDEGQRIKNWESKTSRVIKGLRSRFALVLTGTPIENRIDDLFSIFEFVDDTRLGPAFRFFNKHRVVDERGKVLGYEGLVELREKLAPVLLRRTRNDILKDLPARTNSIVRVEPTAEQIGLHDGYIQIVNSIVNKKHLTEMDFLRLQKALLKCRMAADSTYLVDKEPPGFSSKLDQLDNLLSRLSEEEGRKIVIFSEWTTMLDLIEPLLSKNGLDFVRLDGSVAQAKRQQLVNRFQEEPDCRVFITTNAGSTGLNLQSADTVINVDLPWNPAVLEQRIARAHRMGQKRPVQVYLLVTEGTLEERLLTTLSAKHQLSLATLDMDSQVDEVELQSGMEELKRRLEVLLGADENAPEDVSQQIQSQTQTQTQRRTNTQLAGRKDRIAEAGGRLLESAFSFLGELLPQSAAGGRQEALQSHFRQSLSECIEQDENGNAKLTVTLSGAGALDELSQVLARMIPEDLLEQPRDQDQGLSIR